MVKKISYWAGTGLTIPYGGFSLDTNWISSPTKGEVSIDAFFSPSMSAILSVLPATAHAWDHPGYMITAAIALKDTSESRLELLVRSAGSVSIDPNRASDVAIRVHTPCSD